MRSLKYWPAILACLVIATWTLNRPYRWSEILPVYEVVSPDGKKRVTIGYRWWILHDHLVVKLTTQDANSLLLCREISDSARYLGFAEIVWTPDSEVVATFLKWRLLLRISREEWHVGLREGVAFAPEQDCYEVPA